MGGNGTWNQNQDCMTVVGCEDSEKGKKTRGGGRELGHGGNGGPFGTGPQTKKRKNERSSKEVEVKSIRVKTTVRGKKRTNEKTLKYHVGNVLDKKIGSEKQIGKKKKRGVLREEQRKRGKAREKEKIKEGSGGGEKLERRPEPKNTNDPVPWYEVFLKKKGGTIPRGDDAAAQEGVCSRE